MTADATKALKQPLPTLITRATVTNSAVGFDYQGIPWKSYGTTRASASRARRQLYSCTLRARDLWSIHNEAPAIPHIQIFEFDQTNTGHQTTVEHYQLRNLLASTSRHDFYYGQGSKVLHTSLEDGVARRAIDFTHEDTGMGNAFMTRVTAVNAGHGSLVAGTFGGEYAILDLRLQCATLPFYGQLPHSNTSIVNYVELPQPNRRGRQEAVFASNDSTLRILDCQTAKVTQSLNTQFPVNCSATSPDCRLRLLVGDFNGALLLDAESHRILADIEGMTGDAFACAWQGYHISMASETSDILVYDVRSLKTPLASLPCEMDCTRLLRFSEAGGGSPVLVAAEAADFVNVINAVTFDQKQVIDSFGSIGGITLSEDGQQLVIANSDGMIGGMMSYRRAVHASEELTVINF